MELTVTPTQALLPLSVFLILYHVSWSLLFRKPDPEHWNRLPNVGVKEQWLGWMWATLKSVRMTQEWAFEGYRKVKVSSKPSE